MEIKDVNTVSDNTVIVCINCGYKDIAKTWKDNRSMCIKCKSKAYFVLGAAKELKKKKKNKKDKE